MRFLFLGVLFLLSILLPLQTLAEEAQFLDQQKPNLINITESILQKEGPILLKGLFEYKEKSELYSKEVAINNSKLGSILEILVTGYSSTPDQCWGNPFITASGARVRIGTMACPPQYAFGTKIEIDGMGTYVCEDRGGKIKGNHFDMWFASRVEALQWGKRTVTAKITQS